MPFKPSFLLSGQMISSRKKSLVLCVGLLTALLGCNPVVAETTVTPPVIESVETPAQVVFEVVLAEIALKRDKPQVALAAYADLALNYSDSEIFRRTFEIAAVNRQPDLMLEAARLWVGKDPNSLDALNTLASTQILLGRYDAAEPVLARYYSLLPLDRRAQEFLMLGQRFPTQADPLKVKNFVYAVTAPYLSMPDALLARAQAALRAGDDEAAMSSVREARRMKPDSEAGALLNAQILSKRSTQEALTVLADYIASYPKAAPIRAVYAQQLLATDKPEQARAQLQILVAQPDVNPETLFAASAVAIQAHDAQIAIDALDRLLKIDGVDKSLIEYNLGLANESQGELDKSQERSQGATEAFSEALLHYLKVQPGEYYVTARLRAANLLANQGDLKAAQALLETTPAPDAQTKAELVVGEASMVRDSGDVAGAFKLLDSALKKDPSSVLLRYERGMLAERSGQMGLFEQSMREVIKRDPKYAQAYNALGYTYADQNIHLKESRVLLEKALSLSPNDPFILDSMGWLCFREKNYNQALEFLNRAAELRLDPEIIQHQMVVLKALGRDQEAEKIWHVGMQQFPDDAELRDKGKALGLNFSAPMNINK